MYFEGKIIYSIAFYGDNNIGHASCCLINYEDRLSQVCDLLMAFTLFLFMLLNNGINCQIENNLKQCVNSFCKILHIVLCSINFP